MIDYILDLTVPEQWQNKPTEVCVYVYVWVCSYNDF
jgi:hypothetical protein